MFSFKFTWFLWIVVLIKIHSGSPRWDEVVDSSLPSLPLSSRDWGRWLSPANYSRCLLGWIPSGCACEECTAFSASNLCFPGWPTMRSKEWGLTQSLCQVRLIQTQDLSSFLELADVQAAFPLPAAPGLLTAPHWSCAAFVEQFLKRNFYATATSVQLLQSQAACQYFHLTLQWSRTLSARTEITWVCANCEGAALKRENMQLNINRCFTERRNLIAVFL